MVTVLVCPKLKTSLKSVVFTNKVGKNSRYFLGVFNKTIIPLALVGFEMIIANSYPTRTRGIIVNYWLSGKCGLYVVNRTFIKWRRQTHVIADHGDHQRSFSLGRRQRQHHKQGPTGVQKGVNVWCEYINYDLRLMLTKKPPNPLPVVPSTELQRLGTIGAKGRGII